MNTPSPQLFQFTFGFLARLHAMVGDEQALVILERIDAAFGHASQDGNEVSLQSAYDENTQALVIVLAVSTPTANLTTTAGVIAHLHAVQALVQNNKTNILRN